MATLRLMLAAACNACATLPVQAHDGWQVTVLHPIDFSTSEVLAVAGDAQAGFAAYRSAVPLLWRSSAESWVNLLPQGDWAAGIVTGAYGDAQVGYVTTSFLSHAAYWHGAAETFIDLHPSSGYCDSQALGMAFGQVVGLATCAPPTGLDHAMLWLPDSGTWVDLHIATARWTQAFATDGTRQGGWGQFPSFGYQLRALMWSGSAASVIDMHPPGAGESTIRGMASTAQVGWGIFNGQDRGLVWRGAPASCVDVHPPGAIYSHVLATNGEFHAGEVVYTVSSRAGLWVADSGSAFIDLQAVLESSLGTQWRGSSASCVTVRDGLLVVGGRASRNNQPIDAIIWTWRIPQSESPARRPRPQMPLPPFLVPDAVRAP